VAAYKAKAAAHAAAADPAAAAEAQKPVSGGKSAPAAPAEDAAPKAKKLTNLTPEEFASEVRRCDCEPLCRGAQPRRAAAARGRGARPRRAAAARDRARATDAHRLTRTRPDCRARAGHPHDARRPSRGQDPRAPHLHAAVTAARQDARQRRRQGRGRARHHANIQGV
jgi:hypothetical protein